MRAVLTVLVLVLVCSGCDGGARADNDAARSPTTTTTDAGRPLLVIGDSLTVGARISGRLESTLRAAGWDPEILAEDGRSIAWGVTQVEDRATVPSTVVVALGTNSAPSVETFRADAAALVQALATRGATTIVWLPPQHGDDERYLERAEALRAHAGGPLVVTDWPAVLDAHPEWFGRDGIHLVEAGYRGMARFVRDQLALIAPPTTTMP